MKIYLKKIKKKDIDYIYNLGKNNLEIYYKKGDINNIIMNDDFSAFKVVYNNNIIAFVISQKMYNSRLHINSIAVNKKYRRHGVGTFMINKIKFIFNKYKYITLFVSVKNRKALKLYIKNNFNIVNLIKKYYYTLNEDAYFMYYNKDNIKYNNSYNVNNVNIIIISFILFFLYYMIFIF